jgi:predicted dehydrogenase
VGYGFLLRSALASGQYEIVDLCDMNSLNLDRAEGVFAETGAKKPKLFSFYQEMYKVEDLQAVAIATPTHWHALHFMDACKAGLHVFREKPISYDIREWQAMLAAHQRANNVVLVDFPRTMVDINDKVKALIQSGEVGRILQVHGIHSICQEA